MTLAFRYVVKSYCNGLFPQKLDHFGSFGMHYISSSAIVRIRYYVKLRTEDETEGGGGGGMGVESGGREDATPAVEKSAGDLPQKL